MTWHETLQFLTLCLPKSMSKPLAAVPQGELREIRVRAGRPVRLMTARGVTECALIPTADEVAAMAESLCEHALYVRYEEQRQGFVTLRGGHRMGLCGRVIAQGGAVRALREISSFCVRIAGQWTGMADPLMPYLTDKTGRVQSLLVIGPPGSGKTAMLRDACRQLSDKGAQICLLDERSELAAVSHGAPQLDVGANTDVLDGCQKEQGLRWLLRSMSPDALVTDELGSLADAQAVLEAVQSGVSVLASVHGRELEGTISRNLLYHLMQNHAFSLYAVLDERQVGRIAALYNERMQPIVLRGTA